MGGGWGDKRRATKKQYAAWGQGPCSTSRDTQNNTFELLYRTKVLAAQLCLILCDPMDYPVRLLCPWNSPGKNPGVVSHILLQGSSGPRDHTLVSCIATREAQAKLWPRAERFPPGPLILARMGSALATSTTPDAFGPTYTSLSSPLSKPQKAHPAGSSSLYFLCAPSSFRQSPCALS